VARIGIVGAGAWGTALAAVAARNRHHVTLWAHEDEVVAAINRGHENTVFLPGIALDPTIWASRDLARAGDAEIVLLVAPAQHVRRVCAELRSSVKADAVLVICAKGIEQGSGALLSTVVGETLPDHAIAVLSGPTFAAEVARNLPTAVTIACAERALGDRLSTALGGRRFRPYYSDDVIGTEIGGAVKNVLAIACGIAEGRGFGDNARAALITRGLAEIGRLSQVLGGRPETLMGLSGIGDVVLTCTSTQSRNFSLGLALGRGQSLAEALTGRRAVVEGVTTAASVAALSSSRGVDMPIATAIAAVLHRGADLDQTIDGLLARPFRAEQHGADP